MYNIETRLAAKSGWHTPSEAQRYYGRYSRTGITVHHWNTPNLVKDSDHNNIVNYIANKAKNGTGSVNYVLSNTKITLMVHPDNVAWASQSGNPTTVSIEFSPHLNAEGYKKAGWLIWQLEKRYNRKLTLYPHNHWFATQCPGSLDLPRMRAEANKWAQGGHNPKPPVPAPPGAKLTWVKLPKIMTYITNKQPTNLWDFNKTTWNMTAVKNFKKGEKISIYGKCVNETLKATYLLTEFSFTKKITNGFNQSDMDVYVPLPSIPTPAPKPAPDGHSGEIAPQPTTSPALAIPKEESNYDKRLSALEKLVSNIAAFLRSIFSGFKG